MLQTKKVAFQLDIDRMLINNRHALKKRASLEQGMLILEEI